MLGRWICWVRRCIFLFWRVDGVGDSYVHLEVFLGVSAGLLVWLCMVGGDCELLVDLELFAIISLWWEVLSLLVWRVGGIGD